MFNGLAQVIVQSAPQAGEIKLFTATGNGFAPATVAIQARAANSPTPASPPDII